MIKAILLCVILSLLFLSFSSATVEYSTNGGKTTVVSNGITLVITGNSNVPKFSFGIKQNANTINAPNDEYNVMFQKAYQVDATGKKLGPQSYSLPSYGWAFSNFVQGASNNSLDFVLASTNVPKDSPTFSFNVHLSDTVGANFKFDVSISNVQWASSATKLYLCFKLQQKGSDASVGAVTNGNQIKFGSNGFMSIKTTATIPDANNKVVNVELVSDADSEGSMSCISYDAWNTTQKLFHDPTLGVSGASTVAFTLSALFVIISSILILL
ncbi:hypothetical protein ABK040_015632 [Willaertia magna]